MKKIVLIIVAIVGVGGLVALLNYHPATNPTTSPTASTASVTASTTPGPLPPGTTYKDGTYTGSAVDVGYGIVQVQAVVSGGKITTVNFLQMPFDRQQSAEIADSAKPVLLSETLAAQSSSIDTVTGATADSDGYTQSLEAALTQARS